MTNDNTKDLTDREVLDLILARLTTLEADVGALKAAEAERSKETRPRLDAIHAYVDQLTHDMREVKTIVQRLDSDFTQFSRELIGIKAGQYELERRVSDLERKPS